MARRVYRADGNFSFIILSGFRQINQLNASASRVYNFGRIFHFPQIGSAAAVCLVRITMAVLFETILYVILQR